MTGELGILLTGIAAVLGAIATFRSKRAERTAKEALESTPAGMLEALSREVEDVLASYQEAVRRHGTERSELEHDIERERNRADGAELVVFALRGRVTQLQISLTAARMELDELHRKVDAMTNPR